MDTPLDPALAEDIRQLLTEVPAPIRAFFSSGKVEMVTKDLMQKNKLHIDQGAILEREIILLLLGLKDPAEFTQALAQEALIDKPTIDSIVENVNAQIFVPLREQMRGEGEAKPAAQVPPRPPQVRMPQNYAPPLQSPRYLHSESDVVLSHPSTSSLDGLTVVKPQQPTRPPVSDSLAPKVPAPVASASQKPLRNNQLLEDHEEPHIEFNKAPVQTLVATLQPAQQVSVPARVLPPPSNLPGTMPQQTNPPMGIFHPDLPRPVPPSTAPAPLNVVKPPSVPVAPAKPYYNVDPYREPIEG